MNFGHLEGVPQPHLGDLGGTTTMVINHLNDNGMIPWGWGGMMKEHVHPIETSNGKMSKKNAELIMMLLQLVWRHYPEQIVMEIRARVTC